MTRRKFVGSYNNLEPVYTKQQSLQIVNAKIVNEQSKKKKKISFFGDFNILLLLMDRQAAKKLERMFVSFAQQN